MITLFRGHPGNGKTYFMALQILALIDRNLRWERKGYTEGLRPICANMAISDWVKKIYPNIQRWDDLDQLVKLRGCDIVWDDMSNYVDSQSWANIPRQVKEWLRFHEHYGIEIYGNAQDFMTIDPSVRRLTTELFNVKKIMGSSRPGLNRPPVKYIWGILRKDRLDITGLKMTTSIDEEVIPSIGFPRFTLIKKEICDVFDTTEDFSGMIKYPSLRHQERFCDDENCEYHTKPMIKHA